MPIYDFECPKCKHEFEVISFEEIKFKTCPECTYIAKRVFPKKSPSFNLKYNPRTDICDWNGNKTRYYDEYNKMKAEGKNPRIPDLDGDG